MNRKMLSKIKSFRESGRSNSFVWLLGLFVLSVNYSAHAQEKFSTGDQPLRTALTEFADKSGIQFVYDAALVEGLTAPKISNVTDTRQVMSELLKHSGINYRFTGPDTAVLYRAEKSESELTTADSSNLLPVAQVSNDAESTDNITVLPKVIVDAAPENDRLNNIIVNKNDSRFDKSYSAKSSSSSTKTDTPIIETPQSIQVIKRSLINDQQNIMVSEALRNVSGVTTMSSVFTPAADFTRIRGFAAEQLVDGFTQYYNPGDKESIVNIDRIEVLKGTNGILYSGGSGSPVGGVVNITSKLPQADPFGEIGFKIGTNSWYQPYLDVNQPINDNVLFRFTGEYTNSGSYLDVVETERFNLNPTFTFTDNEKTAFTVQAKVSRWEQPEYQGLPATGTITGDFTIPKNTFIGPRDIPNSTSEFNGVWGTLDHKFNDVWSINLKARYSQSEFRELAQALLGGDAFSDSPFFPPSTWGLLNVELYQEQEERSFLGNLTAKFDYGPTKNTFMIGADHSDFADKGFIDFPFSPGFVDLSNPVFTMPFTKPGLGVNNSFVDNTTYGGYVQWQSTLYERLHLLGSVRIGHVGIDYASTSGAFQTDKTKFLPRVGGVFDITDEFSVFVNYNEGMRGQPFSVFSPGTTALPAESRTLEGGLKFDFAHQLTGQIAGYQIDRTNIAVSSGIFGSIPEGRQRSLGIETDVVWQPTEALSFLLNYAHTNAEFTSDLAGAGIKKGNKVSLVPENSGRLWVNYRFQQPMLRGLSIGGGLYAQSGAYLSDNNNFKTDGFHTFDASVAYEYDRFKLAATIKNLTDEDYFQTFGYLGGHVIPAEGTSAYVTGSVKF
ncbi:MAG: TonB-dependent receptor [Methylococcaceae bacterium]|nr:TonB-dependent receptor [Methylococcaceae bacterium]